MVVPNNRSLRLNIGYNDERKKGRKIFEGKIFGCISGRMMDGIVFVECILYSIVI